MSVTNDERAFKLGNNYISVAERNLLVNDLALNQGISVDTAKLIIENLTLNNREFYKNKIESLVGEPNKRMLAAIIDFCEGLGVRVVLTADNNDAELKNLDDVLALCSSSPVNLGGKLTLKQTAALSKRIPTTFGTRFCIVS